MRLKSRDKRITMKYVYNSFISIYIHITRAKIIADESTDIVINGKTIISLFIKYDTVVMKKKKSDIVYLAEKATQV